MPNMLLLLRHAKSDWRAGAQDDHERPLNDRGRRAAAVMGVYLSQEGLAPDLVLTSSAARTRETCALVLRHAGLALEPVAERKLYLAKPDQILAVLRSHGGTHRRILLIGHNPGLQDFAAGLAGEAALTGAVRENFPTCGLAVCETDTAWSKASADTLALTAFTYPKALV